MPTPTPFPRAIRDTLVALALVTLGCNDGRPPAANPPDPPAAAPDRPGPGAPDTPARAGLQTTGVTHTPPTPAELSPEPPPPPYIPAPPVMARLTETQYRNTLEDLFGPDLPTPAVEPDQNPHLFYSIGATTTDISARGVEQYTDAAFAIARAVIRDPARLLDTGAIDCLPDAADDPCARAAIETLGRRLLRRPLDPPEVERWIQVVRAGDTPLDGLELALAGLLQSTGFLYRPEAGEPDPAAPERRRYTSLEMASRLAFLLTDAAPDDALLAAGERGDLVTDAGLAAQTDRLLTTPRARAATREFFAQYLDLARLPRVERDPARYPGYSPRLLAAMETELRLLVDDVVFRRRGDIRTLFSAPRGYVNSDLAALYAVDAPGATPTAFVPVTFAPDGPRAGLLTLAAFLTMNAHPTETSPTLRGKYVRERVLCQTVPPPPDDIDLNLDPDQDAPATLRERLEQHRTNPACRSCHEFVDPPGYLFEHFDSVGRYREQADGHPIDATGELDETPLADARALADLLADDPRVGRCVAQQYYRYANGRLDEPGEAVALDQIEARMAAGGYRFDALVHALVQSEGFRTLAQPADDPGAADRQEPR